jgi:hypothetical protein
VHPRRGGAAFSEEGLACAPVLHIIAGFLAGIGHHHHFRLAWSLV